MGKKYEFKIIYVFFQLAEASIKRYLKQSEICHFSWNTTKEN